MVFVQSGNLLYIRVMCNCVQYLLFGWCISSIRKASHEFHSQVEPLPLSAESLQSVILQQNVELQKLVAIGNPTDVFAFVFSLLLTLNDFTTTNTLPASQIGL